MRSALAHASSDIQDGYTARPIVERRKLYSIPSDKP